MPIKVSADLPAKKIGDRYAVQLTLPPFSGFVLQKAKAKPKAAEIRYKKID